MLNGRRDIRPKGFKVQLSHLPNDKYGLIGLGMLCLTVLAAIWWIRYLTPPGGKTEIAFSELKISASGGSEVVQAQSELKLVQFWTPSERTGPNLCDVKDIQACKVSCDEKCVTECKAKQAPENRWECTVKQENVDTFEKVIESQFCTWDDAQSFKPIVGRLGWSGNTADCYGGTIEGFHRYDEVGQAADGLRKAGLWWEMTVTKNFDARQFAKLYVDTWCRTNPGAGAGTKPEFDDFCRGKKVYLEVINGSPEYSSFR